jgi:TolB-like protein
MASTWAMLRVVRVDGSTQRVAVQVAPTAAPRRPVLWLLAIGVSRYGDAALSLRFAERDAVAVAELLREQAGGPLYAQVRTRLLTNEEVTRESVLASLDRFLGAAGPDDVVTIFMAGHGVQERSTGSYYFLPYPATAANLVTAGLRMSDFDEMVRVVRRNVRGVVLMLDTCHAGALGAGTGTTLVAEELAARMSVGEGFYLLAATKPGEESREEPELQHGPFTYALLEGLGGAADADGDGLITVSELFGYVARRVPVLTGGEQHPYHKMEGTDLSFASTAAAPVAATPAPARLAVRNTPSLPKTLPNTIGVLEFENLRGEGQYEWIGKALRIAFNTELSKVRALRVYSPELIDRSAYPGEEDPLQTAQRLGMSKLVSGAYQVVGTSLRIDAHIIDVSTGVQQGSDSIEGDLSAFFELQKQLVLNLLRRLPVPFSREEGASIESETNTDVNAYRLLLEAEGIVDDLPAAKTPPTMGRAQPPTAEPQSRNRTERPERRWEVALGADWRTHFSSLSLWLGFAGTARADEPVIEDRVRALLEEYRRALEAKQVDAVASLSESFSPRQREALQAYLENAIDLSVDVSDVVVAARGDDLTVSFTRRDRFTDRETGRPVRLEVRLTKTVVRQGETWKLGR